MKKQKVHFKPNYCGTIGFSSKFTDNRFDVTCVFCQNKNHILPNMMDEFIDKTFGAMESVQDGLGSVFEKAKVRFIHKLITDPTKDIRPWETKSSQFFIDKFEEEYHKWEEEIRKLSIKDEQTVLLDIILTATFLYLKLEKAKRKRK